MTPTSTRFYATDRRRWDAVCSCEIAGACSGAYPAFDFLDDDISKSSAPVLATSGHTGAPLFVAVGYVGELGAEDQMRRVATSRVVAGVQYDCAGFADCSLTFGQAYTVVQAISQTMSPPSTLLKTNSTISVRFDVSHERPAVVGIFNIDERPELVGSIARLRHLCRVTTTLMQSKGG